MHYGVNGVTGGVSAQRLRRTGIKTQRYAEPVGEFAEPCSSGAYSSASCVLCVTR